MPETLKDKAFTERQEEKTVIHLILCDTAPPPPLICGGKTIITRCRGGIKIKLQLVGISRDRIYETIMEPN